MTEVKTDEFKTEREKALEEKLSARTIGLVLLCGVTLLQLLVIAQLMT